MEVITTKQQRTLDSLRRVRPAGGWKGIPHADLIDALVEAAGKLDWTVSYEKSHLSRDRNEMAASLYAFAPERYSYLRQISIVRPSATSIVASNSNSHEHRTTIFGGLIPETVPSQLTTKEHYWSEVGLPLTKFQMGKHHHSFDLAKEATIAMEMMLNRIKSFEFTVNKLKEADISQTSVDKIMMKAALGCDGLMPDSRIMRIIKEWEGKTKWDLLIDFAKMARMNPPLKQMGQVHSFLYNCLKP